MIILKLGQKSFKKIAEIATKFIKEGKVIVCPTDTVYGLVCDAVDKEAVKKIFKIKKRSWQKPLSLFVKNLEMAKEVAKINKTQEKFLKKVWPGRTIVVLKASPSARFRAKGIISKEGKIGLRIPDHAVISHLLSVINSPLAQTSANISGLSSTIEIEDILEQFRGRRHLPDLILDAGKLKKSKSSKVIDLTVLPYKILRH